MDVTQVNTAQVTKKPYDGPTSKEDAQIKMCYELWHILTQRSCLTEQYNAALCTLKLNLCHWFLGKFNKFNSYSSKYFKCLPFSNKFKKYDPSHYTPSAINFLSTKGTGRKSIP